MFIARQPIFRCDMNVYGYELLFREDKNTGHFNYSERDAGKATAAVLTSLYESGLSNLVEGRLAFVNFDESVLLTDIDGIFESNTIVIELDGDVKITPELEQRLRELKFEGFRLAFNNVSMETIEPFADIVDIVKINSQALDWETAEHKVNEFKRFNIFTLAQKIESMDQYEAAKSAGFDLFQGYFFAKPYIIGARSDSFKNSSTVYTRILRELRSEEPSFQRIAEMIRHSVDLNYKLMRMMSKRNKRKEVVDISTVKQALAYMGLREVERWINVLMLSDVAKSKPSELIKLSLTRSLFMEQLVIGTHMRNLRYEAFTVGLFSVIEALSDVTLEDALADVVLPESVRGALIYNKGELSDLLRLVKAYEVGDFETVNQFSEILEADNEDLFDAYYQAVTESAEIALDIGLSS